MTKGASMPPRRVNITQAPTLAFLKQRFEFIECKYLRTVNVIKTIDTLYSPQFFR